MMWPSKRKELTMNCKKKKCMIVAKRTAQGVIYTLGGVIIKVVQKFYYLICIVTDSEKCNPEIWRYIGMVKDLFQGIKRSKMPLETKERCRMGKSINNGRREKFCLGLLLWWHSRYCFPFLSPCPSSKPCIYSLRKKQLQGEWVTNSLYASC